MKFSFSVFFICIVLFQFSSYCSEPEIHIKFLNYDSVLTVKMYLVSPVCWNQDHHITSLYHSITYTQSGQVDFDADWDMPVGNNAFSLGEYKIDILYPRYNVVMKYF